MKSERTFTPYQVFVIAILAILQFTIVLDFMVISPLSAILLEELSITTSQFGLVVSAYAFSAGASGFLASGFADNFDPVLLFGIYHRHLILWACPGLPLFAHCQDRNRNIWWCDELY